MRRHAHALRRLLHVRPSVCVVTASATTTMVARRYVGTSGYDNDNNKSKDGATTTTPHIAAASRIVLRAAPPLSSSSPASSSVPDHTTTDVTTTTTTTATTTAARPEDGPMTVDYGPLRATGLWSVHDVVDVQHSTVDFRRIDDVESDVLTRGASSSSSRSSNNANGGAMSSTHDADDDATTALVSYDEEARWKHTLMFVHKFKKTPRHLTWRQLGEEIDCLDCVIDVDEHRPEEVYTLRFYFTDKATGTRDCVWHARNDVGVSEGLTDLLAAIGSCLGRADVHRTIRFDDGQGTTRDVALRKRARYTSDITLALRPPEHYNVYERKYDMDEYEAAAAAEGASPWAYHPALMDREYSDMDYHDPVGTYTIALSAHGFSYVVLRALRRLLARPLRDFYRASQLLRTRKMPVSEDVGVVHALKGWLGLDERVYPHYTPLEAVQEHWLGADAPFGLCAMINKLREMTYLTRENPEFRSWLAVRQHDTHIALRNLSAKMLGVGASTLFLPVAHDTTVNALLPRQQQRRLRSRFSVGALLGMPDETRRLGEYRQLTGHDQLEAGGSRNSNDNNNKRCNDDDDDESGKDTAEHKQDGRSSDRRSDANKSD